MATNKSLDPYLQIIVALLRDVQTLHSGVFTERDLRLTTAKLSKRFSREGYGFLTKTIPRLGKALDRALTGEVALDCSKLGFKPEPGSKLPRFLGTLFKTVFTHDGWILPTPCVQSIKVLRWIFGLFYKLELPCTSDQNQRVIDKFIETDRSLAGWNERLVHMYENLNATCSPSDLNQTERVVRTARYLLSRVFSNFDIGNISPRHGPGAVSTKETLGAKYTWTKISPRILETYPLDAYFYASLGHVCDELASNSTLKLGESSARVVLVPKDSRGQRLISMESLDFQWIQQGLGRAIVRHVEEHPLTRYSIHFTDQMPNRIGALLGSSTGGYATLDLNEASDRVSLGLVRLLFPEPLYSALMNCRSLSTTLPGGSELTLNKYAPMGSALCFPVLAVTIWALLTAGLSDADPYGKSTRSIQNDETRSRILVYGDDVVVPTACAANAISILESFGLLINRDKSCVSGFFRESCGQDAYKGVDVTPVRIRTVWTPHRCPETYSSYVAYANSFYKLKCYHAYDKIVALLTQTYGSIPEVTQGLPCPSLASIPEAYVPERRRWNSKLNAWEFNVWSIRTPKVRQEIGGWHMLLRFFAEAGASPPLVPWESQNVSLADAAFGNIVEDNLVQSPFSVRLYTKRKTSCLVRRWLVVDPVAFAKANVRGWTSYTDGTTTSWRRAGDDRETPIV